MIDTGMKQRAAKDNRDACVGGCSSGIRHFGGVRDSGVQWDGPAVVFRPFRLLQEETKRPWGEQTDFCTFGGIAVPGGRLF